MTNTIPNVPRELDPCPFCGGEADPNGWMSSDGAQGPACDGCGATANSADEWNSRAPSPAGADGLETICVTQGGCNVSWTATKVLSPAGTALCRLSDAQAIIDGLRGEVACLTVRLDKARKDNGAQLANRAAVIGQRDQQAKRIGELEGLLRDARELITHGVFEDGVCCCGSSVEAHGFGDGHSPVDALSYFAGQTCERIDAALSAGKEGE